MNSFGKTLALLAIMPSAAQSATTRRDPAGAWILDYGLTSCTAQHHYGHDQPPLTLALRPSPNGSVVRLILARKGATGGAYHFDVTAEIGGGRIKTTGLHFSPRGSPVNLIWINLHRTELDALRPSETITLHGGPLNDTFPLPKLGALLDGLDTCNDDLRHYWHADAAGRASLSKSATPLKPLRDYFSGDDYPSQANREGDSGISGVVLMIDETGKPRDCLVEETSGIATLDAQTCAILVERAKFAPALDGDGKPTRSIYTQRVKWIA